MKDNDRIRLRHMLDAALEAKGFARGRQPGDLHTDRMFVLALVKCLEIIGEAAGQLSPEARQEITQVPWPSIINMRNRLIHVYFDINLDIVWQTIVEDLPLLISALEELPGDWKGEKESPS